VAALASLRHHRPSPTSPGERPASHHLLIAGLFLVTMSLPVLPQEIIHQILSNIPTKQLCPLLRTSKAIYLDVTGILHARLESELVIKQDPKLLVGTPISSTSISDL